MGFNSALSKLKEDDFNFMLKNGKRHSVLDGFDFQSLIYCSYGFIKYDLPELIKAGDFERLILKIFADRKIFLFHHDLNRIENNDILHFIFWVKDELEMIAKMEQDYLQSDTDPDLIQAGINELNQFGEQNTIDSLTGGDMTKENEIKALPYSRIFDRLLKMNIENGIQKRLIKIKEDKAKSKSK